MSIYTIGDVQGCYEELQGLLQQFHFDAEKDCLWFVGDLVNRGPDSLKVLRFVKQLKNCVTVIGNHDLHLLAIFYAKDALNIDHTLDDVLNAPDAAELIAWLRTMPLIHYDSKLNFALVHAGIYPLWNLEAAIKYAHEVEQALRGNDYIGFLEHMYGNKPDIWHDNLQGYDRLRFIINAFTRMRFCSEDGKLELTSTENASAAPAGYIPWFEVAQRQTRKEKILFGHWAALRGEVNMPNIYALDTGCIWGGRLTAMRLEDGEMFSVPCAAR
jgi:bis(5'-nucleosyl)-tetraphosphatase (symmetrical)